MVILYIETNFLMGIATGREPPLERFLLISTAPVQLVMPSVCCMEALIVLNVETKRRHRFTNELDYQIGQLQRDLTSSAALALLDHLERAGLENRNLLNHINERLVHALVDLSRSAELVELNGEILRESLTTKLIPDPTDNLILQCILAHARRFPNERKALLTSNF